MFLIPKNSLKKFDPERSCFVLNEFAAAEFSSAIEMLFAAKVVDNKKLSIGFIRHALDEYKHCSIFTKIKNQMILEYKINNKELSFIPNHIYNKGYIYKDHFIFEKKKLGTGGAIKHAYKYLDSEFIVINGDTIFDINIRDLIFNAKKCKSECFVALLESNKHKGKYSYNLKGNRVSKFLISYKKKSLVSGGIYFFKKFLYHYWSIM